METIDILEVFEKCINGKGGCDACPHKEGHRAEDGSTCIARLGKDVINHVNALKAQIEYYEEVIEEYETAELERKELVDKFADTPFWTPDSSPITWMHDGSSTVTPSWTIELDDCTTATTGISSSHAEGITATASSACTHAEGSSACSLGYDLDRSITVSSSSKWELESAVEKAAEAVEAELKKKDKRPRWLKKWIEKT